MKGFNYDIYNVSNKVANIIINDLSIACYGSDFRFDKLNNLEFSIDLFVCNNNGESLDLIIKIIMVKIFLEQRFYENLI